MPPRQSSPAAVPTNSGSQQSASKSNCMCIYIYIYQISNTVTIPYYSYIAFCILYIHGCIDSGKPKHTYPCAWLNISNEHEVVISVHPASCSSIQPTPKLDPLLHDGCKAIRVSACLECDSARAAILPKDLICEALRQSRPTD